MIKKSVLCILLFLGVLSVQAIDKVRVEKWPWLKNQLSVKNDTTYVINFWATWCLPCTEELPVFETMYQRYQGQKVKIILVSLDFIKKLEITVQPYLQKMNYHAETVLLNEPDYNSWIPLVNKKWEGSIPATIVFNQEHHYYQFIEKSVDEKELDHYIQQSLSL
ncbi:MAG TPA: TlpA disulfide reductase family protein [Chitinophagaceae bacterium]|nr:TlpA disulfide reductase family protein [Chitinophagaceae bacterium]HNF71290.1 TlpA disulfide reductase family protein [Chitinophagaceae bacterium]